MIKYVIAFCILASRNAGANIVGDFDQIILAQHSPVASFALERIRNPYDNVSSIDVLQYLSEHLAIFDPERWIVHGLWPIKFNAQSPTLCESSSGARVRYEDEELNEGFRQDLKIYWPSLTPNKTEDELWHTEYNVHGSCITSSVSSYFNSAMYLVQRYNMGALLRRAGIVPGFRYGYYAIALSIANFLHKLVYIKCLPDQLNERQYLLEVHVCFTSSLRIVHCHNTGHDCDIKKLLSYTGRRRD